MSTEASGRDLLYFDPVALTVRDGSGVRVERVVTGDPGASTKETAVFRSDSIVTGAGGEVLSATRYDFCVDRTTAAPRPECPAVRLEGGPLSWFGGPVWTFPRRLERADVLLPDPASGARSTARYLRDGEIDGLLVYAYKITTPRGVVDRQTVPAELAGGAAGTSLSAEVVSGGDRYLWVEPVSGAVVEVAERQYRYLQEPGTGRPILPFLVGGVAQDPASVAADSRRAADLRLHLQVVEVYLPVAAAAVAFAALVAGIWLLLEGRRRSWRSEAEEHPGPAAPWTREQVDREPAPSSRD